MQATISFFLQEAEYMLELLFPQHAFHYIFQVDLILVYPPTHFGDLLQGIVSLSLKQCSCQHPIFWRSQCLLFPYLPVVVSDNLNIHKEKSFYEAFSEDEAKKILDKIEFHYTPKHASWLNAAEIEINVMDLECTGRRIGDIGTLTNEVDAWTKRRNKNKKKINWKFTKKNADEKLSKHYVS